MRKMTILLIVLLFLVFTLVGCNGASAETVKTNDDMFEVAFSDIERSYKVCLCRDSKYYSLEETILIENSEKYDVGIRCYSKDAVVYFEIANRIITTDDFAPIVIKAGDKILDYDDKEIAFRPVEFEGYVPRAYVCADYPDMALYWPDDTSWRVMLPDCNSVTFYDEKGNEVEYENFKKGDTYTMKWNDQDGYYRELSMVANGRSYSQKEDGSRDIRIEPNDMGEYLEYDVSILPPGTYYIVTKSSLYDGALITIE